MNKKEPFLFSDFKAALAELQAALERGERYLLLSGESGTGKTTLIRSLTRELDRCRYRPLYFNLSMKSPLGLVRVLAQSLRAKFGRTHAETVKAVAQVLAEDHSSTLLWMDEAQALSDETFNELKTLVELDLEGNTPIVVLLSGLPALRERLEAPQLFPFFRRFHCRVEITGLRKEEARPFLLHHFGEKEVARLNQESLSLLFEHSRGIPALLYSNLLSALRRVPKGPLDAESLSAILENWKLPD
jgi:type II secretory pathway predicted ATPase ExeA